MPYDYVRVPRVDRARLAWLPTMPLVRSTFAYEELTFVVNLARRYRPRDFDVTIGCGFPFTDLFLTRWGRDRRPPHVYVTENGDWPARFDEAEFKWFRADGLVCTNFDYYEANKHRWRSVLIPNGIDVDRFVPGPAERERLGLPVGDLVVGMASALTPYKRVLEAIAVVAAIPGAQLIVAGDGELRDEANERADRLMPGRFQQIGLDFDDMPAFYRSVDVVLHMAPFEPFGNVYIESIACGAPLVAHRNSSTEWILDGVECELVDAEDADAVTSAVERAVTRGRSDVPASFRERYNWRSIADDYRQFLHEVVAAT